MNDDIARHLGLSLLSEIQDAEIVEAKPNNVVASNDLPEAERDYKYARENFIGIIERGTQALEDLLDVATQSQHPRAYEVLATTMKTLIDANKDLVEMSRKQQQINSPSKVEDSTNKVTNNLFVGSTNDLQKILRDMKNGSN